MQEIPLEQRIAELETKFKQLPDINSFAAKYGYNICRYIDTYFKHIARNGYATIDAQLLNFKEAIQFNEPLQEVDIIETDQNISDISLYFDLLEIYEKFRTNEFTTINPMFSYKEIKSVTNPYNYIQGCKILLERNKIPDPK